MSDCKKNFIWHFMTIHNGYGGHLSDIILPDHTGPLKFSLLDCPNFIQSMPIKYLNSITYPPYAIILL